MEAETAAALPGGVGALLRREGLLLVAAAYWRRERADGIREALTPRKRGPKVKRNPMVRKSSKTSPVRMHVSPKDLRKAHIIIDAKKK